MGSSCYQRQWWRKPAASAQLPQIDAECSNPHWLRTCCLFAAALAIFSISPCQAVMQVDVRLGRLPYSVDNNRIVGPSIGERSGRTRPCRNGVRPERYRPIRTVLADYNQRIIANSDDFYLIRRRRTFSWRTEVRVQHPRFPIQLEESSRNVCCSVAHLRCRRRSGNNRVNARWFPHAAGGRRCCCPLEFDAVSIPDPGAESSESRCCG
jgi:hypothetical protein